MNIVKYMKMKDKMHPHQQKMMEAYFLKIEPKARHVIQSNDPTEKEEFIDYFVRVMTFQDEDQSGMDIQTSAIKRKLEDGGYDGDIEYGQNKRARTGTEDRMETGVEK